MNSTMLSGKTALVTGSTSGIGLGIARSLAAQGANVVFNGFGDAGQIEALHTGVAREFGVRTGYSGADPEAGIDGIDLNPYPRSRTFTAGVSVGF